jgi:UDP-N-acetylglucosamine acyltransferase
VKAHPLAAVSPLAQIGRDVEIGPFAIIEPDVTIGEGSRLEGHVVIKSGTTLGSNNTICEGTVIGGMPQHINVPERPGRVIIGSGNTFRENVTVHRAMEEDEATVLGNDNFLMAGSHVAHDCRMGNNTILTNNSVLGGHVSVADRAYISGLVAVHQFCRVGTLAMVGGTARVVKDVPPYVTIDGVSTDVVGVNQIGLRRAGYGVAEVRQIKEAYRIIYRSGLTWNEILARLRDEFPDGPAAQYYPFLSTTARGIVPERRLPPGATLKLRRDTDEGEPRLKAQAG